MFQASGRFLIDWLAGRAASPHGDHAPTNQELGAEAPALFLNKKPFLNGPAKKAIFWQPNETLEHVEAFLNRSRNLEQSFQRDSQNFWTATESALVGQRAGSTGLLRASN